VSTTLLTGMTGISLHMQWPLTSQLHGSFLKENNSFFVMDQTPHPTYVNVAFWKVIRMVFFPCENISTQPRTLFMEKVFVENNGAMKGNSSTDILFYADLT
jgi:hypothetical protein